MHKPYVSDLIEIFEPKPGEPIVIAKFDIAPNTVVEACSTLAIAAKTAILIKKNSPALANRLLIDQTVIENEYKVFSKLGELELERRLDEGSIGQHEYLEIMRSHIKTDVLLDAKSHLIPLGNGLAYRTSDTPNLVREFDSRTKLCSFRAVKYIEEGTELTYFAE